MGLKGLLLSFLGVGAVTGTVIGGYCIFAPEKTKQDQISFQELGTAILPASPAEPNNIDATARGADSQTANPERPEPGSAVTRNTGSSGEGTAK